MPCLALPVLPGAFSLAEAVSFLRLWGNDFVGFSSYFSPTSKLSRCVLQLVYILTDRFSCVLQLVGILTQRCAGNNSVYFLWIFCQYIYADIFMVSVLIPNKVGKGLWDFSLKTLSDACIVNPFLDSHRPPEWFPSTGKSRLLHHYHSDP